MTGGRGGRFVVDDLRLDGAHVQIPAKRRGLAGLVGVFGDTTIFAEEGGRREINLGATLYGSGRLSFRAEGDNTLVLRGQSRDFAGGWNLRGNVLAHATASLGTGPITIESGTLRSNDTVRLAGALEISRPGKLVLDQFWEFECARVDGTVEIPPGDHAWADLDALGLGGVFGRGIGTLNVRRSWSEAAPELASLFPPDPDAPVVRVARVQKRGASFHHPTIWGSEPAPKLTAVRGGRLDVTPCHYVIGSGGALRTTHGSMSTDHFGGLSLTVEAGGSLMLCSRTSTLVVHDLRLAGGQLVPHLQVYRDLTPHAVIAGRLTVTERSHIARSTGLKRRDQPGYFRVTAELSGDAPLVLDAPKLSHVAIESPANDAFSGGWEVLNSTLRASSPGALGRGSLTVKAGAGLDLLAPQSGGALIVEEGGELSLAADSTFTSATIAGEELAAGEHRLPGWTGVLRVEP